MWVVGEDPEDSDRSPRSNERQVEASTVRERGSSAPGGHVRLPGTMRHATFGENEGLDSSAFVDRTEVVALLWQENADPAAQHLADMLLRCGPHRSHPLGPRKIATEPVEHRGTLLALA